MSHDKLRDRESTAERQSQDARRHRQDARHHGRHPSPLPGVTEDENATLLQPEVPKVGSRDAPGG